MKPEKAIKTPTAHAATSRIIVAECKEEVDCTGSVLELEFNRVRA
jgi:hypothetical protein